jgi:integrase
MAYWRRETHGIVVYTSKGGKQRKLPRGETRHLDTEPDHNIETWVRNWELTHEGVKRQYEQLDHPAILDLVETFCVHLASRRKTQKTIKQHRHNLARYCLPFFVQKEELADPILWPTKSVRLLAHLEQQGVAPRTINICNVSMRVFWTWLVEEGRAAGVLLLRNAVIGQQETPLNFTVVPQDILARLYDSPEMRLLTLIGYFFSLRPQELVALRAGDFRAGSRALETEAGKVMAASKLYGRLVVNVSRQRRGKEFAAPKANSKGWVACFDERAAREIVAALAGRKPDELLFSHRLDWWFRLWKRHGYPGLKLKDLRRASIYWLGNYTELPFTALKNHARHADPSTTALYVRRPGEGGPTDQYEELDLDA